MKTIKLILFSISIIAFIYACNKPHDYSYTTGTFSGEIVFKEIVLVDGIKTDESSFTESGSISMIYDDSMTFTFNNSIYSVSRTFHPAANNIYHYTLASENINDRFEVYNVGFNLKYYGTRMIEFEGNDTARFFEVNFNGARD